MHAGTSVEGEDDAGKQSSGAAAATAPLKADDDEEKMDFSQLHPSVRFYRGMWKLTQLTEDDEADPHEKRNASQLITNVLLTAAKAASLSPTNFTKGLSVVALHQRLLPPAPVNGLGEVADESYAAQLATSDGIEFLRVHWHLLLPLLFPCSRYSVTNEEGKKDANLANIEAMASQCVKPSQKEGGGDINADAAQTGGDVVDKEANTTPESQWTAQELFTRVQRPLSEVDLKVVREPGHMDRIYYSYIVLLRFFGWRVHDEERGLLDRNRAWAERYALLELYRTNDACEEPVVSAASPGELPASPTYTHFNFYEDGLPRVLRGLLDVGFLRLAVRLVEFVIEEMKSDRLLFLLPLVENTLLPLAVECENVEASHKARLKKQLYRVMHSDSD